MEVFLMAQRFSRRLPRHPDLKRKNLPLIFLTLILSVCFTGCSSGGSSAVPNPSPTPTPAGLGGSNYGWYYLDSSCNREPYGVVYNYDTAISHNRFSVAANVCERAAAAAHTDLSRPGYQLRNDHGFDRRQSRAAASKPISQVSWRQSRRRDLKRSRSALIPRPGMTPRNGPPSATIIIRRIGASFRICVPSSRRRAFRITSTC